MRTKMENEIDGLNTKKRDVSALNVSLKSKLETLQKLEKEAFNKLSNYEDKSNIIIGNLQTDYTNRNNERNELEANNKLKRTQLNNEIQKNKDYEFQILSEQEIDKITENDFEDQLKLIDDMKKSKEDEYEKIVEKIDNLNKETTEDKLYVDQLKKNEEYKEKIESLMKDVIDLKNIAEGLETENNYLIEKKKNLVDERKKLVESNIELNHEIESKNQINELRIQKKVKELNSEEVQKLNEHLDITNKKINEFNDKIDKEVNKIKNLTNEIIKCNIEIKRGQEKQEILEKSINNKNTTLDDITNIKNTKDKENEELKEKIIKAKTDFDLIRNRHKILAEEYAALNSKYLFITKNYDYTSNLRNISLDDLKNLRETNKLVNNTISNFENKIGGFRDKNIQNMFSFEGQ